MYSQQNKTYTLHMLQVQNILHTKHNILTKKNHTPYKSETYSLQVKNVLPTKQNILPTSPKHTPFKFKTYYLQNKLKSYPCKTKQQSNTYFLLKMHKLYLAYWYIIFSTHF